MESPVVQQDNADLPDTQILDDRVLKDVVVYVEVRSSNDNRSKAICRELEQLGAKVVKKFSDDVTHVVYKEGTKRTRGKAKKKGIHLVSVLWVDSCKLNHEHMSEKLFPVSLPDERSTPIFVAKLKKAKSMQPRDFEDDMASSAERCNKRRVRNVMVEKWKMAHGTPTFSPRPILAEDTQPRTPIYPNSAGSTPISLTIPDTPPSMKAKLEALQRAKLKAFQDGSNCDEESPVRDSVAEPLQRRLFEENGCQDENGSAVSSTASAPKPLPGTPRPAAGPPNIAGLRSLPVLYKKPYLTKKLLSLKENSPQAILAGPSCNAEKTYTCSPLFLNDGGMSKTTGNKTISKVTEKVTSAVDSTGPDATAKQAKGRKRKMLSTIEEGHKSPPKQCSKAAKMQTNVNQSALTKNPSVVLEQFSESSVVPQNLLDNVVDDVTLSGPSFRRRNNRMRQSMSVETTGSKSCTTKKNRRRTIHEPSINAEHTWKPNSDPVLRRNPSTKRTKNSSLDDLIEHVVSNTTDVDVSGYDSRLDNSTTDTSCNMISSSIMSIQNSSTATQATLHGLSMSMAFGNATLSSTLTTRGRPSIDEFSQARRKTVKKTTKLKSKAASIIKELNSSTGSEGANAEDESGISSGTGIKSTPSKPGSQFRKTKSRKSTTARKPQRGRSTSGETNSTTTSSEGEKIQKTIKRLVNCDRMTNVPSGRLKKSLVMTSLHTYEQEVVISVVKQLGGFYMTDSVLDHCSHVVCGETRRTLNLLHAISRGCWVLSQEWVLKSLEAGHWLDEELYELGEQFPAAKVSRQERQSSVGPYKKTFFSSVGLVFLCKKTSPPRDHLVTLVQQCGGQVTTCQRKARVIVSTEFHPDIISVSPQWILDTVTNFKLQPFNAYATSRPKKQSSPEF